MKNQKRWMPFFMAGILFAVLVGLALAQPIAPAGSPASLFAPDACATVPKQWLVKGNCGTNPRTNFIGTTDNQPLVFKTNKVEGMRLATNGNLGIGTTAPGSKLTVAGLIQSTSGGFKFPDGTTQTTAASLGNFVKKSGDSMTGALKLPANGLMVGTNQLVASGGKVAMTDATANSLTISSTAAIAVYAKTSSGGEAVYGQCTQENNNCYAVLGVGGAGDYAGYFSGGRGLYSTSSDDGRSAVRASASGGSSYGVEAQSSNYRAGYFKSNNSGLYSLYVDSALGPSQGTSALEVSGSVRIEGNIYVAGSKAGYVVDVMQNVGDSPLAAGDVVVIVGNSAPVLGEIPVVTVKKANTPYDTGVAGIVDEMWYAPDSATKAGYDAQDKVMRAAMDARAKMQSEPNGAKSNEPPLPKMKITDEQGTLHAMKDATRAEKGGYVSVVTLGSFKVVKVDASFGAIHSGDLLTTSSHAGYAMKVTDKVQAIGAIIGKALGNLDSGTGTIPVLVMPK